MSSGPPKLSTSLDESQLSQVRECLPSFAENTSPGLHQDATMDNSYSMGFRSPSINALTGHGSPVQVRSLRENEEEISSLRKENFNLKLRIYFLEHKVGICTDSDVPGLGVTSSSASGTSCDGNQLKQNIDLKVEVESLRRELQEKQDLLCQAAKAIEVLEDGHRKTEENHREMVADLNNRIEMHQLEIKSLEKVATELQHQHRELQLVANRSVGEQEEPDEVSHVTGVAAGSRVTAREAVGESLLDFLDTVQQHSEMSVQEKLKALEMDGIIRQCQERNEELNSQVGQLQAALDEKTAAIGQLEVQLRELRFENAEMREKLDELPSQADLKEVERLKRQLFDIRADRAEKICLLDDAEAKLKEKTVECTKSCRMVEKLVKTITEQDKEIAKLKRNSNISLASEHGTISGNAGSLQDMAEIIDEDRKPVSQTEYDALVQRAKQLQDKNDKLIHKLCGGGNDHRNDRNIIIKQLNDELIQAREEAEKAQKWRKDCADLCAISTLRLEELAGFLDSLLKNKEFVGTLSMDRRKAIRKAVDRSLDLSRSLNMSISVTGFSLAGNNSLAQLSCLSGYLEQTLNLGETNVVGGAPGTKDDENDEADKENRTSNNTKGHDNVIIGGGNPTKQMIETLRAENKALRGELLEHQQQQLRNKRRESKERKVASVAVEPISDSEAWSEPDRGVSLARIGLEDKSVLLRQKQSPVGVSTGSVLASSVTGCGALQELSSTSDNESAVAAAGLGGGSSRKGISAADVKQLQDTVTQLNGELREKDDTIRNIQARLADLDGELRRERTRLTTVETEADGNRQAAARWEREADESRQKAERAAERLMVLESDIRIRDAQVEKLMKEREQAAVDLRVAEMKLEALQADYEDLKQRHKRELDAVLAREQQHLSELRQTLADAFHNEMQLKQQSFETTLAQNYISKNIHQEKLRELDELHYRLEDAHNDISAMGRAEEHLRAQLTEGERVVAAMKKSLDEATLQASKAAVERTKALNEKRLLEVDLGRVRDDMEQLKGEKDELNQQLQLVMQRTAAGATFSGVARTCDGRNSASATDEEPTSRRRLENSSPDLGIESDPGRLSNVELAMAGGAFKSSPQQRPLLKTLELTKSMSNLLLNPTLEVKPEDGESSKGPSEVDDGLLQATTIVKHDCAKIEADYSELRRRYKETRRCLSQAYDNIKTANKRKEQLEVDIKQQIHKTRAVLRTVHSNMDPTTDPR